MTGLDKLTFALSEGDIELSTLHFFCISCKDMADISVAYPCGYCTNRTQTDKLPHGFASAPFSADVTAADRHCSSRCVFFIM